MLGRVKAEVYRIKGVDLFGIKGKGEMQIWVDPSTELPAKIEIRDPNSKVFLSFDRFEWNKPLEAEMFQLDVPEGYTIDDSLGGPPPASR
jgi:outer membrane lipoprotein-sorting protein